ncbi:hypothetical protein GWI33_004503 [Rhynchophorus ferrugineus]|uniref:Uncharacterized protein n=1 Tax=Rhynchophorus ferrugineus TaxID=354439 RepID=A0A834MEM7_RHYFE|nr:hypothetical protein GWI33_004503 [Rhynchophorus ferrugineus]
MQNTFTECLILLVLMACSNKMIHIQLEGNGDGPISSPARSAIYSQFPFIGGPTQRYFQTRFRSSMAFPKYGIDTRKWDTGSFGDRWSTSPFSPGRLLVGISYPGMESDVS